MEVLLIRNNYMPSYFLQTTVAMLNLTSSPVGATMNLTSDLLPHTVPDSPLPQSEAQSWYIKILPVTGADPSRCN